MASCRENEGGKMGNKTAPVIEFLGKSNCPLSPTMEQNLRAALQNAGIANYQYIDLELTIVTYSVSMSTNERNTRRQNN